MARFEINQEFFDEVVRSDAVVELLNEIGPEIWFLASENAAAFSQTGAFEASLQGELRHSSNGRPYFRVWSDDPGALSIEFGNSHQAPHRALGRAIGSI